MAKELTMPLSRMPLSFLGFAATNRCGTEIISLGQNCWRGSKAKHQPAWNKGGSVDASGRSGLRAGPDKGQVFDALK